jgi:hypothetical protein
VLPWPFVLSARALPAAARITARPTTRIFVILTFLIRQHSLVIYSTPQSAIRLDRSCRLGRLEGRAPASPFVVRCPRIRTHSGLRDLERFRRKPAAVRAFTARVLSICANEALTATVQKVGDKLELNRPTAQVVVNNQ